ncbi:MAG TPA: hypothetical protein VHU43_02040 [Steroidobacteraceae bacterium]|jgi:hypothetical protein|nr:hypothetical protein [Steroidobacteraceae bacterium]
MIMPITFDLIIVSPIIPVFVAMVIGAHRVMIVRSILRADQRGGYTRHRNGGEYQQGRLPKVLTHGAILK